MFQGPGAAEEYIQGAVTGHWGYGGANIAFGVREHAMGSITNGLALHGGLLPYAGTFLIFSDYMRPAIRLAALSGVRAVYVFTHDSIALGEDGPTHQPVEQLAGLRAMPGIFVIRPSDAGETAEAWKAALRRKEGPTALVLSRQAVPVIDRKKYAPASLLHRGAYVLSPRGGDRPDVIIIATGSEVHLALEASESLALEGISARVVSMPCWELFEIQPEGYRDEVLPPDVKARVSVEAGASFGWRKWVGDEGEAIGVDMFGASAPGGVVLEKYGLTAGEVAGRVKKLLHVKERRPAVRTA